MTAWCNEPTVIRVNASSPCTTRNIDLIKYRLRCMCSGYVDTMASTAASRLDRITSELREASSHRFRSSSRTVAIKWPCMGDRKSGIANGYFKAPSQKPSPASLNDPILAPIVVFGGGLYFPTMTFSWCGLCATNSSRISRWICS